AADSAGRYFHCGLDPPHRRPALAATSSRHLLQRPLRRDSLLLAGEIRGDSPARLRRYSRRTAPLAFSRKILAPTATSYRRLATQAAARAGLNISQADSLDGCIRRFPKEFPDALQRFRVHRFGDAPRLRILLAGMVHAKEARHARRNFRFRAVRELVGRA